MRCPAEKTIKTCDSIHRSTLLWASVQVILWVCFTAVIAEWTLDFLEKFSNLCIMIITYNNNISFILAIVHSIKIICSLKKFKVKFRVQIRQIVGPGVRRKEILQLKSRKHNFASKELDSIKQVLFYDLKNVVEPFLFLMN